MASPDVSVIIPCFNKRGVLTLTLDALNQQGVPAHRFEVILVDDGSSDGTWEWLLEQDYTFALQLVDQVHKGAGAARNLGASQAIGRLLLFLDADIVAARHLLQAHLDVHELYEPALVVGRIQSWIRTGHNIHEVLSGSFDLGPVERKLRCGYVVSGNLSIKSSDFARVGGFDENLLRGQDVDLGRRAEALGLELLYWPTALGYHNHALTLSEMSCKVRRDHAALVDLFQKCPEMLDEFGYLVDKWPVRWRQDPFPLIIRKGAYRLLATLPIRSVLGRLCQLLESGRLSPALLRFVVWKLIGTCQLLGLRDGMKQSGWRPDVGY